MKKYLSLIMILSVFVILNSGSVFAEGVPDVYVNGLRLETNAKFIDDRTMVPLRAIFEALGYNVDYDNITNTAIAGKRPTNLPPSNSDGTITIIVNGSVVKSDVAPFIDDGTTYVPVRFISEAAGLNVEWDDVANAVYIGASQTVTYTAKMITDASKLYPQDNSNWLFMGRQDSNIPTKALNISSGEIETFNNIREDIYNLEFKNEQDRIYTGFRIERCFRDSNYDSVSFYGSFSVSQYGIIVPGPIFIPLKTLGYSSPDPDSINKVLGTFYNGDYLIYDWSSKNKGYYRVSIQPYKRDKLYIESDRKDFGENNDFNRTFYEYKDNLYWFERTGDWEQSYTLVKYDLANKKRSEIFTKNYSEKLGVKMNRLMMSNGEVFEKAQNEDLNVYSLSGKLLRSIKVNYENNIKTTTQAQVEGDKIFETVNGDIYYISTFPTDDLLEISRGLNFRLFKLSIK